MLQLWPPDLFVALQPFTAPADSARLAGTCRSVQTAVKASVFQTFRMIFATKDDFGDLLPFSQILTAIQTAGNFRQASKRAQEELCCFSAALGLAAHLESLLKISLGSGSSLANSRASDGSPALHLAVLNGNQSVAELLVKTGADLSARDVKFGRSALMVAAKQSDVEMFAFLVNAGADITLEDYSMKTVWHHVIGKKDKQGEESRFRKLALVRILASRAAQELSDTQVQVPLGPDRPDLIRTLQHRRALITRQVEATVGRLSESTNADFLTAIFGALRVAGKSLLRFSQDSPLIRAVSARNMDALKIILAAGDSESAVLDQTSHSGKTALFVASEIGFEEGAKLLLSAGASLAVASSSGRNPLHACIEHGHMKSLVVLLTKTTVADITRKCSAGISPFMLAENRGKQAMVHLMLQRYDILTRTHPLERPHPYLESLLKNARRPASARLAKPMSSSLSSCVCVSVC